MGCGSMKRNNTQGLIFVGIIFAGTLIPQSADACHEVNVCVRFKVEANDLTVGDLPDVGVFWGGGPINLEARNVRVLLVPPVPEPPFEAILDDEGCFLFDTEWVWGHKLLVYPQAFHGDSQNIRSTGYGTYSDLLSDTADAPWFVDLKNLVEGADVNVYLDADDGGKRLFAWANWIIGRLEDELSPGLAGATALGVYSQDPVFAELDGDIWANLGGYATSTRLYLKPDFTLKRFTIAHEIGHWLHSNWTDEAVAGGYAYSAIDDACKFSAVGSNSLHGLRSAEYGPDALREGFAHFIAAWVFDDQSTSDAQFKYYKTINDQWGEYEDLIDNDYIVSLLGGSCDVSYPDYPTSCPGSGFVLGGDSAWVEYHCPNDWAYNNNEISSELDWMRFFWQLSSSDAEASTPIADLDDLLILLEATGLASPNWGDLDAEVSDIFNIDLNPWEDRFDDLTPLNGVNNGNG